MYLGFKEEEREEEEEDVAVTPGLESIEGDRGIPDLRFHSTYENEKNKK